MRWRELPELLILNDVDALVLDNYDFYAEVLPIYVSMGTAQYDDAAENGGFQTFVRRTSRCCAHLAQIRNRLGVMPTILLK